MSSFTSIINATGIRAILAIGAISTKAYCEEENEVVVGNTMKLTLACDHRTVDGASWVHYFCKTLQEVYVENPVTMLA